MLSAVVAAGEVDQIDRANDVTVTPMIEKAH
jgi:hypothetical protein